MTLRTKIYIALAACAFVIAAVTISSITARHREGELKNAAEAARREAENAETAAREAERRVGEYKRKIEYLEDSLSALRLMASKQDEELKQLENTTNTARGDVGRARAVRSLESTTAELCAKLAGLGHPCG